MIKRVIKDYFIQIQINLFLKEELNAFLAKYKLGKLQEVET